MIESESLSRPPDESFSSSRGAEGWSTGLDLPAPAAAEHGELKAPERELTADELKELLASAKVEIADLNDYVAQLTTAIMKDTGDADQHSEDLRKKAEVDKLTGLGNPHAFAGARARFESPEGAGMAVCVFDLGNLTLPNNIEGHTVGDSLLERAGDSLRRAAKWCNEHCEPVGAAPATGEPAGRGRKQLIPPDRGGFRQGGDEFAWALPNTQVTYTGTNAEGEPALVMAPLAEVFVNRAGVEFGTIMFCGADTTSPSAEVVLGVSSLTGGYAECGQPGALSQADAASAEAKKAHRLPVLERFLADHREPAPDSLGRVIQIKRDAAAGGVVIVDGKEERFDKIIVDKKGNELPLLAG